MTSDNREIGDETGRGSNRTLDRDLGPYLREGGLLLGFVLLLAAATVTVVLPELSEDPDEHGAQGTTEADAGLP